jgi:PAS domain S-box-containing protein
MPCLSAIFGLDALLPWQCLTIGVVVAATAALCFSALSRRRLRKALELNQRDQARLRALLSQMPSILWTTDKDLRITSSEGAGLEPLGIRPGEVVGRTLQEYFKTDDPNFIPLRMHFEALAGRTGNYELQWGVRTYLAHCEPLHDTDNQICGVIVSSLDITVTKTAQQTLARIQAKNRALLEAIPDVMFSMTRSGRIVEFIDKLMAPADFLGKRVTDVFPPTVAQHFLATAARVLDTQRTQLIEYQTGDDGGDAQRFFEARVVNCCGDEVLVIVRNITERKRAENDLRLREAQLRALVRAIPDMIFQLTPDGRIAGCVAPDPDDLFVPAHEFLGRALIDVLPPHVAAVLGQHLRAAVETGQTQVCQYTLEMPEGPRCYEARLVSATGDGADLVTALVRNITDARTRPYTPAVARAV